MVTSSKPMRPKGSVCEEFSTQHGPIDEAKSPQSTPQPLLKQPKMAFAPDFFVIGTMKGGTTSLHRYLNQFPSVSLPRIKETDFFTAAEGQSHSEAWYRSQFDLARPVRGEVAPNYTKFDIFPGVPERISRYAPNARLIFIARDPVERFASHYRHSWSFRHMRVQPPDLLKSDNGRHMIQCSCYGAQIERFLDHFGRHQFLFLDFDALCLRPQSVCDEVADFLKLDRRPIQNVVPANTADQISRVPSFVLRGARSSIARKLDRLISQRQREFLRQTLSVRKPEPAPELDPGILADVADLLRTDTQRFRRYSGMEFKNWRI